MTERVAVGTNVVGLILCLGFFQGAAAGYSMSPLISTLEPANQITTAEVVVKTEGEVKAPVAIELKVKGREVSLDGAKISYPEDKSADNFVVYPSQIVLMPGDVQRVQIRWVGKSIPDKELAYGLIAEEAPIKLGDENEKRTKPMGRLSVLVRYEGAIVVRPNGIKPNTVVDSVSQSVDSAGNTQMILTVHNKGTGRQKLPGMKLQVTPLDANGKLLPEKRKAYAPILTNSQVKQSLFPGYKRRVTMAWPAGVSVGPVRVDMTFPEEK